VLCAGGRQGKDQRIKSMYAPGVYPDCPNVYRPEPKTVSAAPANSGMFNLNDMAVRRNRGMLNFDGN